MAAKTKWVQDPNYRYHYRLMRGKKEVAAICLYDDGLIEFGHNDSRLEVALEDITSKNMSLVIQCNGDKTLETKTYQACERLITEIKTSS